MKKYLIICAVSLFAVFGATAARAACTSNQIDVTGNGTNCQTAHFSVTTTNDTDAFGFYMSAAGTFYIDWGDGTVQTINRTNNTDYTKYEHQYSLSGTYTVRFGGTATGYNSDGYMPTITFNEEVACNDDCESNWSGNIASISGSLSALFPMFGTNDGRHPSFPGTFFGCTGLTSIPADLFGGITTGASNMFDSTFYGCTGLTSIPADLFSGITTAAEGMFNSTFSDCTGLTSIPAGLFSGIITGAEGMFSYTFSGCTGLTSIPAGLFSGITTGAYNMFENTFSRCTGLTSIPADLFSGITTGADYMFSYTFYGCTGLTSIPADLFSGITTGADFMFSGTFNGCTGLTSIPADLFSGITTGADSMFYSTFSRCTGLTSIPADLFSGITIGADNMFSNTFYGCTGLTSIPAELFGGITTVAMSMFYNTFAGCTGITGYIPKSTFAGLIAARSPASIGMWSNTFTSTQLSSTCPSGTDEVQTTYKGTGNTQWGNYAMCEAKLPTYIPTSQSYVTTEINKLQNKFAGSGANKLMTYPTTAGGTPGSRDIVTTLGTPNATTGVYSNTTDTTIPTTGAVKTGVDAKQNNVNGTADYVMTNTGVAGVVGEKAIYGSNTQFTDALVEVGTVNSAIINAVNSELTQVDETGSPSSAGVLWRINSASDITKLTISE